MKERLDKFMPNHNQVYQPISYVVKEYCSKNLGAWLISHFAKDCLQDPEKNHLIC
jgi:hypothetical protein